MCQACPPKSANVSACNCSLIELEDWTGIVINDQLNIRWFYYSGHPQNLIHYCSLFSIINSLVLVIGVKLSEVQWNQMYTCKVVNFIVMFDGNVTIIDIMYCPCGSGFQIITNRNIALQFLASGLSLWNVVLFICISCTFHMLFMCFLCASPWLYWGILTA